MLQKFKITSCALILFLFGLTLTAVSPVFSADSAAFKQCQQIKSDEKFIYTNDKLKLKCFRDLARSLQVRAETVPISNAGDVKLSVGSETTGITGVLHQSLSSDGQIGVLHKPSNHTSVDTATEKY